MAQYDGTYGGAWTGDIGANCGQAWYHNDDTAGYFKDTMDDYYPACTWLDADHTGTTESASMKFKIASYGEGVTDTVNNADQCDATLWGPDKGPISREFLTLSSNTTSTNIFCRSIAFPSRH